MKSSGSCHAPVMEEERMYFGKGLAIFTAVGRTCTPWSQFSILTIFLTSELISPIIYVFSCGQLDRCVFFLLLLILKAIVILGPCPTPALPPTNT